MIPPEITTLKNQDTTAVQVDTEEQSATTTSEKKETTTQEVSEPSATTTAGTNEVVVHQNTDGKQKIGCKQGEFLPSTYCNKVSV